MRAPADERPLTLVAVGPLTNVALALEREPGIVGRIDRIAIMGGAIGLGNWTPSAEFNIFADPEAAQAVLGSGVPITLVPLEVTHRALATEAVIGRIAELGSPVSEMSVALMRYFAETYQRVFGFDAPAVHDPCAVAAVIDAALVPTRRMNVAVDTTSELSLGRTVCDVYGTTGPGAERRRGDRSRCRALLGPRRRVAGALWAGRRRLRGPLRPAGAPRRARADGAWEERAGDRSTAPRR